jgi:predicted nucleic acid-binding protein
MRARKRAIVPLKRRRVKRYARKISELFVPSLVLAEIRYGLWRLPEGKRRSGIEEKFDAFLQTGFANRVLTFDASCADGYAKARVAHEQAGRPVEIQDALIGGMAIAYGAILATWNVADFEDYGLTVINPWQA